MRTRLALLILSCTSLVAQTGAAAAWGATGHAFVSGLAIETLAAAPNGAPEFVRNPDAAALIAALSVEPDRSRGSGRVHDEDRDPGHYINLDADGLAQGVRPLTNVTRSREDFDTLLRARGVTQYRTGYLPYTIIDGWQQVAKDFAYWRALTALIDAPDVTEPVKAWARADRRNREMLTLRDIGVWSHYVGDASQPMHVSQHSDGWGPYPNPLGLTQRQGFHAQFEGTFVRRFVSRQAVAAKVRPYRACKCPLEMRVSNYLAESGGHLIAVYELEKAGAFAAALAPATAPRPAGADAEPFERGITFAAARMADGAAELRDMIIDAWTHSLDLQVGYPAMAVKAIIDKPASVTIELFGGD